MIHHCLFCNQTSHPVHVHGHYQCAICHTNILPCCDSDNCDTNLLLVNTDQMNSVIPADKLELLLQYAGLKKPQ